MGLWWLVLVVMFLGCECCPCCLEWPPLRLEHAAFCHRGRQVLQVFLVVVVAVVVVVVAVVVV